MSKKQIIIIVIVGIVTFLLTFSLTYELLGNKDKILSSDDTVLKLDNYTLKYGKYTGIEEAYNQDNGKVIKTESKMELTKKEIKVNSYKSTYSVKGNKLITSSGIEYEVFDNNKLRLLAGSGIEYGYEA